MTKFSCPSCGADLIFQSVITIFATCTYCQAMVMRRDLDLENLGTAALVQEDMSVIQIGTTGAYRRSKFEILGRVQMLWDGGFWNEWYAAFDNGRDGWIGEAQGSLMVTFKEPRFSAFPNRSGIKIGDQCILPDEKNYAISDIKYAMCVSVIGELPVVMKMKKRKLTVDLTGESSKFATFDYGYEDELEKQTCWIGTWETIQSLGLKNLREIDGWLEK